MDGHDNKATKRKEFVLRASTVREVRALAALRGVRPSDIAQRALEEFLRREVGVRSASEAAA